MFGEITSLKIRYYIKKYRDDLVIADGFFIRLKITAIMAALSTKGGGLMILFINDLPWTRITKHNENKLPL